MKRILISSCFLLLSIFAYAQQDKTEYRAVSLSGIGTAQAIKGLSDTLRRADYRGSGIDISLDTTATQVTYKYRIDSKWPESISVTIPCKWDEPTARSILKVLDRLARTNSYPNKWIVNDVCQRLADLGNGSAAWQKDVALKAAILDFDYAAKYNSFPAIASLPRDLFMQDVIIDRIKKAFRSPYISRKEAESRTQWYTPPHSHDAKGRHYAEAYKWEVGKLWEGCDAIISSAGNKRVYSLAPLIESFATPEIREKLGERNAEWVDLILARLRYKDYYQQQARKYINVWDSCIVYLKSNTDHDIDGVEDVVWTILDCREKVKYIGVPETYYRGIPVISIPNKIEIGRPRNFDINAGISFFYWGYIVNDTKNRPDPGTAIPSIDWGDK